MGDNLIPHHIIDKNGRETVVYRKPNGKGRPNLRDRAAYKSRAAQVPAYSPYKMLNTRYADDIFLGDVDAFQRHGLLRFHNDGAFELIGPTVEDNIDITKDEIRSLVELPASHYSAQVTLTLADGTRVRRALDGALIFSRGEYDDSELNPYVASKLIQHLSASL